MKSKKNKSSDNLKTPLPRHPFFDNTNKQASFIDCIDALNRIRDMLIVCDYLQAGMSAEEGISPNVVAGHYWLPSSMQDTLRYISQRLLVLHRRESDKRGQ